MIRVFVVISCPIGFVFGVFFGVGDLPSTCFPVHPTTYDPPNHGWGIHVDNQPCGKPGGLPLGEIGIDQLVHACSRCSPLKAGSSRQGPPSPHEIHFRITYRHRPTRN